MQAAWLTCAPVVQGKPWDKLPGFLRTTVDVLTPPLFELDLGPASERSGWTLGGFPNYRAQDTHVPAREESSGKRGRISGPPPAVLGRLGIAPDRWIDHVRAVRPKAGFYRAIGSEAALAAIGQRWLRGLSIARSLQP